MNRGKWAGLEEAVRNLAKAHGSVWIFTGPIFAGNPPIRTIGPAPVAVPSHFFKVVLCVHPAGEKEMFAFVLPNTSQLAGELSQYAKTVNLVERLTGLNFFSALPSAEQNRLERSSTTLPAR